MKTLSDRLRAARIAAGYPDATAAAAAFGWKYPTYAGHENGSRGARPDAIKRYARAFNVDPAWLQFGSGKGPGERRREPPSPDRQLSEPVAEPFIGRSSTEASTIERLAQSLAPDTNAPALYVAASTFLDLGIFAGDILLLDLRPGDINGAIVIVNVANTENTGVTTAFARAAGGVLTYPVTEMRALPPAKSGENSAVLGMVTAVLRRC